jgi:valyl-tRNA synthetase
VIDDGSNGDVLATVSLPGGGLQLLPSGDLDVEEAKRQLAAKREFLAAEIERAEKKLANEKFVAKAPAEVVAEERRKLDEYREALARLDS